MRRELRPHPDTPCAAVERLTVEIARSAACLSLHYILEGRIAALVVPPLARPARADELWRHTCFEAFLRPEPGEAYQEFNLAPSRRWAAYRFDGYRAGMADLPLADPVIAVSGDERRLEVAATLAVDAAGPARLGLSAVIEDAAGRTSYWALAHPPGRPDFHSPDCLALQLPALQRP